MIDINLIGRFQDFRSCHHSSWIIQAPWAFRAQLFALLMEVPPCGACFEGLGYHACDIPKIVIFLKLGYPVVSQSNSFPDDWVTSLGYVGSTFLRNPQLPVSRRVQDPTCIGLGPWGRSWNPGRGLISGFKHYLGVSELGCTRKLVYKWMIRGTPISGNPHLSWRSWEKKNCWKVWAHVTSSKQMIVVECCTRGVVPITIEMPGAHRGR